MSKSLITLLLSLLIAGPAWAQDESGDVEEPASADTAEAGEPGEVGEPDEPEEAAADEEAAVDDEVSQIVDPEFDDAALDDQSYEEDDDDFVPSQEIPADEPIPFPSNI
jgi:hypothetical protein